MHVDEAFMKEVGLDSMPPAEKQAFMEHAEEELEVRVGQQIGANLTNEQLTEFSGLQDPAIATAWLDKHVPNFRSIVLRVYQDFKTELSNERANILSE